jgi:hypothetical protein
MTKQTRLLFILGGLISSSVIITIKTNTESTFIDKIETPAEILSRCEQDIDTMNPDNGDSVKHILKIAIETIDIGSKQIETSVNLLKAQPKPKESILCLFKQFLRPRYEPIKGLSYEEVNICTEEAHYKMKIILLNQKIKEQLEALSKHDQAIVRNIYEYIIDKIKYKNELLQALWLRGLFITNNYS